MVRLVEVYDQSGVQNSYGLRTVYVNPSNVGAIRADDNLRVLLESQRGMPDGLDPRQEFTKIVLNDSRSSITVVGNVDAVYTKMFAELGRKLLRD
jgi:hypothetical protein